MDSVLQALPFQMNVFQIGFQFYNLELLMGGFLLTQFHSNCCSIKCAEFQLSPLTSIDAVYSVDSL